MVRRFVLAAMHAFSVAWTVDHDCVTVVEQAVDEDGCPEVVLEMLAPRFPGDVAGNDGETSFVVAGLLEPDLIDDEKPCADAGLIAVRLSVPSRLDSSSHFGSPSALRLSF